MHLNSLIPHGFCLAWDPGLVWLQAASDLLIALAYFSIPAALLVFLRRRRDLAFRSVFGLFAAFILACGSTHVLAVVTLFAPIYWTDGVVKAITAALSIATAIMLWPLLPKAIALPSPAALSALNAQLEREVEERDATAIRLLASEQRLRELYARSPAILHATDNQGTLIEVSQRWLELFGYARAEVIGRNMQEFYAPGSVPPAAAHIASLMVAPSATRDRRIVLRNGETREAEATYALEQDEAGGLRRILVALTDVTARKQAEAALRESEERLRHAQKMEAVGQLTGGIAHDFNNLLTTIMASLEMLEQHSALDARGQRLAANALEGARRAARLTSQLLTFSRRSRLTPESLHPAVVIGEISELLSQSAGGRIRVTIGPAADRQGGAAPWTILADRSQLEAAVLNLVINARDAIAGEGSIEIGFANRALTPAEGAALRPDPVAAGDYVGIMVRDTGSGMTPDVLARAFEPFFTTKTAGSGTGLGLSQSYGFAVQSGGTLRIDTAPGCGTTVEILLPRDVGPAPLLTPVRTVAHAAAVGGATIVVAEDDALLRHTISTILRDHGYTVAAAADGPAALALLHKLPAADLLLTDVMMPGGMNGVQLAALARADNPDLLIMFATGFSEQHTLSQWPEKLDVMNKPFSLDDLLGRIAGRLGAKAHIEPQPAEAGRTAPGEVA